MDVRGDRVVQVECSSENRAYDLPYVGIGKIEGHIAGLSGGRARTRRWYHGRCCGTGRDKRTLPAAIGGDRTVYSRLRSLQAARLLQGLQTRLRRQLLTISQHDERHGDGERPNGVSRGQHYRCWRSRAARGSAPGGTIGTPGGGCAAAGAAPGTGTVGLPAAGGVRPRPPGWAVGGGHVGRATVMVRVCY